jgi:hypothetical protein
MYNYNFNLKCTYQDLKDNDELSETIYRKEILEAFLLDENIDDKELFDKLSEKVCTMKDLIFKEDKMKSYAIEFANRLLSDDIELGLMFFFSYDLFWATHNLIISIYNNTEIDNSIYDLIEKLL